MTQPKPRTSLVNNDFDKKKSEENIAYFNRIADRHIKGNLTTLNEVISAAGWNWKAEGMTQNDVVAAIPTYYVSADRAPHSFNERKMECSMRIWRRNAVFFFRRDDIQGINTFKKMWYKVYNDYQYDSFMHIYEADFDENTRISEYRSYCVSKGFNFVSDDDPISLYNGTSGVLWRMEKPKMMIRNPDSKSLTSTVSISNHNLFIDIIKAVQFEANKYSQKHGVPVIVGPNSSGLPTSKNGKVSSIPYIDNPLQFKDPLNCRGALKHSSLYPEGINFREEFINRGLHLTTDQEWLNLAKFAAKEFGAMTLQAMPMFLAFHVGTIKKTIAEPHELQRKGTNKTTAYAQRVS